MPKSKVVWTCPETGTVEAAAPFTEIIVEWGRREGVPVDDIALHPLPEIVRLPDGSMRLEGARVLKDDAERPFLCAHGEHTCAVMDSWPVKTIPAVQ